MSYLNHFTVFFAPMLLVLTNITWRVIISINIVEISRQAQKEIVRLPVFIQEKLRLWIFDVENLGLHEVQKTAGYHDEVLKGKRKNQRSIRLNRAYRAIYEIKDNGDVEFIHIAEVNKHDY